MTDFEPLIARPSSLLLGAAAQLGIFFTFVGAKILGFTNQEAGAIGIIGGADGPTAIYVTTSWPRICSAPSRSLRTATWRWCPLSSRLS